jgi:hypothetical protein
VEALTDEQQIKCCKFTYEKYEEEEEPKYCTQKQASWFILKFMEFSESNSIYVVAEIMNLHILIHETREQHHH